MVAGVLIILAAVAAVVFSRLWPGPSRKYQTRFAGEDGRPAEEVVAEASEEDTPAADAPAGTAAGAGDDTPDGPSTLDRDTAIDSWDELTRGDDPTR